MYAGNYSVSVRCHPDNKFQLLLYWYFYELNAKLFYEKWLFRIKMITLYTFWNNCIACLIANWTFECYRHFLFHDPNFGVTTRRLVRLEVQNHSEYLKNKTVRAPQKRFRRTESTREYHSRDQNVVNRFSVPIIHRLRVLRVRTVSESNRSDLATRPAFSTPSGWVRPQSGRVTRNRNEPALTPTTFETSAVEGVGLRGRPDPRPGGTGRENKHRPREHGVR